MPFNLVKAMRNTHRSSINKMLHFIGAPLYVTGILLIVAFLFGMNINPVLGFILWISGVALFLMGHMVDRNIKATTPVVVVKYLLSKL
jgi:hypothetical protein